MIFPTRYISYTPIILICGVSTSKVIIRYNGNENTNGTLRGHVRVGDGLTVRMDRFLSLQNIISLFRAREMIQVHEYTTFWEQKLKFWVFWTKWFARTCRIKLNEAITDVRTKHNFIGGEGLSLRVHMPFSTRKTKPKGMPGASKSVRLFNDPASPETTFFQSPEGSILRFLCWKSCRRNKFGLGVCARKECRRETQIYLSSWCRSKTGPVLSGFWFVGKSLELEPFLGITHVRL